MSDMTFYNLWRTEGAEDRAALLDRMKGEAPALASKAGFVSITVLECADDGRVLDEGRWQSKDAFDATVAGNPEAKRSRTSLEEFGSPEPGLFTEVFRVSAARANDVARHSAKATTSTGAGNISFVQIWRMSSAEHQQGWLKTMHSHIGILTVQPGFVSMSLHTSLGGKQAAVYAQWASEAALNAALICPKRGEAMMSWQGGESSMGRPTAPTPFTFRVFHRGVRLTYKQQIAGREYEQR
jgi:heme-degrading monooxygenase HmoA